MRSYWNVPAGQDLEVPVTGIATDVTPGAAIVGVVCEATGGLTANAPTFDNGTLTVVGTG
jgi:hypothetical protein